MVLVWGVTAITGVMQPTWLAGCRLIASQSQQVSGMVLTRVLPADCFEFPHIIHIGVASVALVVFVVLATAFTTAEIDLNPASQNLLGMAHSK